MYFIRVMAKLFKIILWLPQGTFVTLKCCNVIFDHLNASQLISVLVSLKKNWFTDTNLWTVMYVYSAFGFFGKCLKHMALEQH